MKTKQFNKFLDTATAVKDIQSTIGQLRHFVDAGDASPELMKSLVDVLDKQANMTEKLLLRMI